jgi:hypothetical protein
MMYGETTGEYTILDSSIKDLTYTAINLTPGRTYKFKIRSKNLFDYSVYSLETVILAAQEPATPATPTTTF